MDFMNCVPLKWRIYACAVLGWAVLWYLLGAFAWGTFDVSRWGIDGKSLIIFAYMCGMIAGALHTRYEIEEEV